MLNYCALNYNVIVYWFSGSRTEQLEEHMVFVYSLSWEGNLQLVFFFQRYWNAQESKCGFSAPIIVFLPSHENMPQLNEGSGGIAVM